MNDQIQTTISLNGCDNVGKTTALGWLARAIPGVHRVGTIDRWHSGWANVSGPGFARWWFEESSTAEHVELVMLSHQVRRAASGSLALEDRGHPMLHAACAATAVVKDKLHPAEALEAVKALAAQFPTADRAEVHVLLRHSDAGPDTEAELALAREPDDPSSWYASYQLALARVLELQNEQGIYDLVLTRAQSSILDLQRALRRALARLNIPVQQLTEATPQRVWVVGGMSEAGKSTLAELMVAEHGATRLKIGYLLELAAIRAGITDPYSAWSEYEQAERLVEELLIYCEANKSRVVSLESAHRFESTFHLRDCLGEVSRIVYLTTHDQVRGARATELPDSLARRDALKTARGAGRIAEIADVRIDNSGPLCALKLALPALSIDSPGGPRPGWAPATNPTWLFQVAERLVDDEVAMVLATGGTGRTSWLQGWSDIDLLVVRDQLPLQWLRAISPELAGPDGCKVGLSCFTPGELTAGQVPPRVVHALRQAQHGDGILYLRVGYHPPTPSRGEDDRASRSELGLVLMTVRRLLSAPTPDIRAVHKHLVLLAKILLRADGHDIDDPDQVLTTFAQQHPGAGIPIITTAHAAGLRTCGGSATSLVSALARITEYIDQLTATVRSSR